MQYPADSDKITYTGRVVKTGDGSVSFDWSGVYLRFRFTGDRLAMRAGDTRSNYYLLFIDGKYVREINIRGEERLIELGCDLGAGVHRAMLYKRTEAGEGTTTIRGFTLADGGKILAWTGAPTRKIEFIGDSMTCGFGSETTDPGEEYTAETENAYHSYASVAARLLNADYTLIAHSGQGVVRNYGDSKRASDYTMRQRFFTAYDQNPDPKWDFSLWRPDAVVINLGTNDFSTSPLPSAAEFIKGYRELLSSVRKAYGEIPIFCLSSPMSSRTQRECVEKAATESNDKNMFFIPMYSYVLHYPDDYGAGHPNSKGHQKLAMLLAPYISSVMGWTLGANGFN
ncbi:endoglucanase [Bacteroidia bacterium]|nr:endoglucanase [Bacteroidia bacterium]